MTKKIKDSEILEILVDMDARVTPRWKVATKRRGAPLGVGTNSAARQNSYTPGSSKIEGGLIEPPKIS